MGETLTRSGIYYHLSKLKESEIIEHTGYRKLYWGTSQKLWRIKTMEIKISLITKKNTHLANLIQKKMIHNK